MRLFGNYCESYFDRQSNIVKRRKYSEGVYKTEFTKSGYFRINNEGWNSHRDYFKREESGNSKNEKENSETGSKIQNDTKIIRIAIVGHSNIEGLRVHVDKTLSKIFENDLNKIGINAEVYTFGYGGMHLAQAMHVSKYVTKTFQPDILIIGTFLNDFWIEYTDKKNFLNLKLCEDNRIEEVVPQKYTHEEESLFSFLYFSKVLKYTDIKLGIGRKINILLDNSNKSYKEIKEKKDIDLIGFNYILNEFDKISKIGHEGIIPIFFINFPLIIPSYNYDFNKLNNSELKEIRDNLINMLQNYNFQVNDLEKEFLEDYYKNSKNFDFKNDYHYNEHAHEVIGMKLSDYFKIYLQ